MSERPELNWDLRDAERRFGLVALYATVEEVDYSRDRARVRAGDILSDWLVWGTSKAQNDRAWRPVEVGEQVLVVAPHGDLSQGCIVCSIHAKDSADRQSPASRPTVDRIQYDDGTIQEYDRAANKWLLDMREPGGVMEIRTGTTIVRIEPNHVLISADRIDWRNPGAG